MRVQVGRTWAYRRESMKHGLGSLVIGCSLSHHRPDGQRPTSCRPILSSFPPVLVKQLGIHVQKKKKKAKCRPYSARKN